MSIHCILPPEAYLEEQPPVERIEKPCPYGLVDCLPLPDGRLQISRVISTDPAAYLASVERVARLPVKRVFPAHHSLDIQPEMLDRVRDAFRELKAAGKLRHGGGKFDYGDFGIWV